MDEYYFKLSEEMLKDFTLEEILELNDLTDEQVLELLLNSGVISEPERYFD